MLDVDFMKVLRGMRGVSMMLRPDDHDIEMMRAEEESVGYVSGGMRYNPVGIHDCLSMDDVFVIYCDKTFEYPPDMSMKMIDDYGVVIGHNISRSEKETYMQDPNILWLSECFVMYGDRITSSNASIHLFAQRFNIPSVEEGVDVKLYFPTMGVCQLVRELFGGDDDGTCIAILGVDGLCRSMPVADMMDVASAGCCHGESASEDTFYR